MLSAQQRKPIVQARQITQAPPGSASKPALGESLTAKALAPVTPLPGMTLGPDGLPPSQLTSTQTQQAIAWYKANKTLYSSAVIRQIQLHLGISVTGKADIAFVKAVARWQDDFPLSRLYLEGSTLLNGNSIGSFPNNGILEPQQIVKMFPFGLMSSKNIAQTALSIEHQIKSVKSKNEDTEKAKIFKDFILGQCKKIGIFPPRVIFEDMSKGTAGKFWWGNWEIKINLRNLKDAVNDEDIRKIFGTLYHEARHAEQVFTIVRYLAGKKMNQAEMIAITSLPRSVVAAGYKKPLLPASPQAIVANDWFNSLFGSNEKIRSKILEDLDATDRAKMEKKSEIAKLLSDINMLKNNIKSLSGSSVVLAKDKIRKYELRILALKKEVLILEKKSDLNYLNYRNLPEEKDAWDAANGVLGYWLYEIKK